MVKRPILRMTVTTSSPGETRDVAECVGRLCRGREVLLLNGDLGSGKTCFVQGLARGMDVDPETNVASPTFVIHAEYPGRLVLNHLDLYRLDVPAAQDGLGIVDLLGQPGSVAAIEWAEMLAEPVAGDRMEVLFVDMGEGRRSIDFSAYGPMHARLIEEAK